jgi:glycine cleavage system transcriptional repressor
MQQLVITAVGADRPGLIDEFTHYLYDAGANLADSRMVNLRGQFAFMALVEADDGPAEAISQTVQDQARAIGLQVTVTPLRTVANRDEGGLSFRLRAYALDQPGIAHRIANVLHRHAINIEELQTQLAPGPYAGRPKFAIDLRMTVPAGVPVRKLREELAQLSDSLNCDIDMEPA